MRSLGFDALPAIVWRKQTNAPNKFMGSGMLPAGAYVTLEHEFILIFRKGGKRDLTAERDRERRGKSAFFWEERNKWFSDLWDFKGAAQELRLSDARARSAAFPFELAYRLINMYSLYEDTVLDPFMGLGTTGCAAVACGRNSVGVEIEGALAPLIMEQEVSFAAAANEILSTRIQSHNDFIESYQQSKGPPKYCSKHHGFPVVTRQETGMRLFRVSGIRRESERDLAACYEPVGMLR
jgi:DNA modification methylase